jgi:hypothetical protein
LVIVVERQPESASDEGHEGVFTDIHGSTQRGEGCLGKGGKNQRSSRKAGRPALDIEPASNDSPSSSTTIFTQETSTPRFPRNHFQANLVHPHYIPTGFLGLLTSFVHPLEALKTSEKSFSPGSKRKTYPSQTLPFSQELLLP